MPVGGAARKEQNWCYRILHAFSRVFVVVALIWSMGNDFDVECRRHSRSHIAIAVLVRWMVNDRFYSNPHFWYPLVVVTLAPMDAWSTADGRCYSITHLLVPYCRCRTSSMGFNGWLGDGGMLQRYPLVVPCCRFRCRMASDASLIGGRCCSITHARRGDGRPFRLVDIKPRPIDEIMADLKVTDWLTHTRIHYLSVCYDPIIYCVFFIFHYRCTCYLYITSCILFRV